MALALLAPCSNDFLDGICGNAIPLQGWNWPQCLHCRCRRGCEHSLSAAPHLSLLLEGSAVLGFAVFCSYQDFLCPQQNLQPVLVSLPRDLNAAVCRLCSAFSHCTLLPKGTHPGNKNYWNRKKWSSFLNVIVRERHLLLLEQHTCGAFSLQAAEFTQSGCVAGEKFLQSYRHTHIE